MFITHAPYHTRTCAQMIAAKTERLGYDIVQHTYDNMFDGDFANESEAQRELNREVSGMYACMYGMHGSVDVCDAVEYVYEHMRCMDINNSITYHSCHTNIHAHMFAQVDMSIAKFLSLDTHDVGHMKRMARARRTDVRADKQALRDKRDTVEVYAYTNGTDAAKAMRMTMGKHVECATSMHRGMCVMLLYPVHGTCTHRHDRHCAVTLPHLCPCYVYASL